jgi:polyisoprenoid-binding protein YceI
MQTPTCSRPVAGGEPIPGAACRRGRGGQRVRMWPRTWRGRLAVIVPVCVLVVVGVPYSILAFTTRHAPPPVELPPAPIVPPSPGQTMEGSWIISSNGSSFVGYRIRERLGFFPAPNDAVGRTTEVKGSALVSDGAIREARFTADLVWLVSDEPARDPVNTDQGLQTSKFPTATFVLTRPVEVGTPRPGQVIPFRAHGRLTVHGVTRPVVFVADGRWDGDAIHVAGHADVTRAEFGIEIQSQLALRMADDAVIEAQLAFHRAGASPAPTPSNTPSPLPTGPPAPSRPTEPLATGSLRMAVGFTDGDQVSIATVREDGSGFDALTHGLEFGDDQPAWSPDGRLIAFSRGENRDPLPPLIRIFVMQADGSKVRAMTKGSNALDSAPAWSPDGTRIAFVRDVSENATGRTEIFTIRADGTDLTRLTDDPSRAKDNPSWSPDGTTIAYVSFGGAGNEDIWVMDADGSNPTQLTSDPRYEYSPMWSPDGTRIAFARDGDIWVMDADGSHQRKLTSGPEHDGEVEWAPEGTQLVFTRDDRIIVMNPDGSRQRRVPLHGHEARSASIRP